VIAQAESGAGRRKQRGMSATPPAGEACRVRLAVCSIDVFVDDPLGDVAEFDVAVL
jgi:hypothetical protein